MTEKLAFDTLKYAQFLTDGGVEHGDVHSAGLAMAIPQNFYTKNEVDKMFDVAIKQFEGRSFQMKDEFNERSHQMKDEFKESLAKFDERSFQMRDEFKESLEKFDERTNQMREEIRQETKVIEQRSYEIEIRFERAMRNHLVAMIAILGSLIVVTNGLVSFFAHSSSWDSKQAVTTAIHAPVQTTPAVAPKNLQ